MPTFGQPLVHLTPFQSKRVRKHEASRPWMNTSGILGF